jgi:hypothetical protein
MQGVLMKYPQTGYEVTNLREKRNAKVLIKVFAKVKMLNFYSNKENLYSYSQITTIMPY